MYRSILCLIFFLSFISVSHSIEMKTVDNGVFKVSIPKNWEVIPAGQCSTFAIQIRDSNNPERQIFFFSQVGPLYLFQQQKIVDYQAINMGGYIPWAEMPVIEPFTPENFLSNFYLVKNTQIAQNFLPSAPPLQNLNIISSTNTQNIFPNSQSSIIRAVFRNNNTVSEGLFKVTTLPVIGYTGAPGGGIGYAQQFMGITAPKDEFEKTQKILIQIGNSFSLSNQYVTSCMQAQRAQGEIYRQTSKTLSETSDIIMQSWNNRNKSDDILSAKRSDTILERERVYNPETGSVYEVDNGFYDNYNIQRNNYEMDNLQRLPNNNHNLWTAPLRDGAREIH